MWLFVTECSKKPKLEKFHLKHMGMPNPLNVHCKSIYILYRIIGTHKKWKKNAFGRNRFGLQAKILKLFKMEILLELFLCKLGMHPYEVKEHSSI